MKHLLVVVILSTLMGCGASTPESKAIAAIEGLHGYVQMEEGQAFYVSLCETEITDAELVHLKEMPILTILDVSDTDIGNAGLEHLQEMTQLKRFAADNTNITDAGLEHIKQMPQLQRIDLLDTKVSDEGIEQLKAALPKCLVMVKN